MADDNITPEDELKAENELLKLKLEMEHGMQQSESKLPPEAENEWLNYIYNFEKQFKDAKRIKVYDYIGQPPYRKIDDLAPTEIEPELDRLLEIMGSKGVSFSAICDYPDEQMYKFVTEELFDCETDDMHVPGMMTCFTYEEFHPNHEYDITEHAEDHSKGIFNKECKTEYRLFTANDKIEFNGDNYSKEELSQRITAFHELHSHVELRVWSFSGLTYSLEEGKAQLNVSAEVKYEFIGGGSKDITHNAVLYYDYQYEYWTLVKIDLPEIAL